MCPNQHGKTLILAGVVALAWLLVGSGCNAAGLQSTIPAGPANTGRPPLAEVNASQDDPGDDLPSPLISTVSEGDLRENVEAATTTVMRVASATAVRTATATPTPESTPIPAFAATGEASPAQPDLQPDEDLSATAKLQLTPTPAAGRQLATIPFSTTTSLTFTTSLSITSSLSGTLNGLLVEKVIVLPADTREHVRQIFLEGQLLGRNARAFSRLGASVVATYHFMGRFDTGPYDLGPFSGLLAAVDHFAGSFSWVGMASARGLTAWAAFDPLWANPEACQPNESPLDCEVRIHNPAVLLVALGTNEKWDAVEFDNNLRRVVEYAINNGIIPVLATKADRFVDPDNRNNQIIRRVAADYAVPLLDFDLLSETLPARGMTADEVHLTLFDYYDYNMPRAYETGYGMLNLSALMMLQALLLEFGQVEF